MDLKATILQEHSKAQTDKIVSWVGGSQSHFDQLFNLFISGEYRLTQRAAWPLSYCVIRHPSLIKKHFGRLINNLKKPAMHDAVKRNTIRLLQVVEIPAAYRGKVMEICFNYISSPTEAVAIKAFALTVLYNLSKHHPEIKNELKLVIEERWDYETAAFHSRAKKILKKIITTS